MFPKGIWVVLSDSEFPIAIVNIPTKNATIVNAKCSFILTIYFFLSFIQNFLVLLFLKLSYAKFLRKLYQNNKIYDITANVRLLAFSFVHSLIADFEIS